MNKEKFFHLDIVVFTEEMKEAKDPTKGFFSRQLLPCLIFIESSIAELFRNYVALRVIIVISVNN